MKKGGPALRQELGDISYLESHPEVCQFFKYVVCYKFCEKIQGSHQQVVEAFSLSFDGSKALIGKEDFLMDETLIVEVTELPKTREKWFNTTCYVMNLFLTFSCLIPFLIKFSYFFEFMFRITIGAFGYLL